MILNHGVRLMAAAILVSVVALPCAGQERSVVAPLVNLLKSGRLPEDRMANIVGVVCDRGSDEDLGFVFDRVVEPDGFSPVVRDAALDGLLRAAEARKRSPAGDLSRIVPLFEAMDARDRGRAIELAGQWRVAAAAEPLESLVLANDTPSTVRHAAIEALVRVAGAAARQPLEKLAAGDGRPPLRFRAIAGLAAIDLNAAAERAADVLQSISAEQDPGLLVQPFLDARQGAELLAAAMDRRRPKPDVARRMLRYLYSVGRTDPALANILSDIAGINHDTPPLSTEELARMLSDIAQTGDPQRGEAVFRRGELSCMKCHAVSGAGGNVGPDLSGVGTASPLDYLLNAVMFPDQAVKEEFQAHSVLTIEGRVFQGIIADQNDDRIVIREATGEERLIAADDIEEMIKSKSLMPQGLTNFMTRGDLINLVSFLAQLGRPGPYAVRSTPTVQRWRQLESPLPDLLESIPNAERFDHFVLNADDGEWARRYSKVAGSLPLDELLAHESAGVVYLQFEVDVTAPGEVGIDWHGSEGIVAWVDDEQMPPVAQGIALLQTGRHRVTLRVNTSTYTAPEIRAELFQPAGSTASATPVGGR